ncbi:phosphate--AMP phosphotransferase [Salinicoccus roseus]|uniref:phosphate--AMP phosphotransferase n=1 Tax=Salinicoccus roseus TaxID=45670 RepID=UPI000F4E895F|nr:phosphate--AMP phosphotransferase [Salinicoccus roseus]RPE51996.1 polyphosphate:AMP phosphotransferase [Salinicoccus roseus]GGA74401.1 polyphosphate--AMP phosphotransferase [Salinicoccus roseus]
MVDVDEALETRIGEMARKTKEMGIPLMIVIEGPPASGKSRLSNALYMALDAKYTDFMATRPPRDIDLRYPFLQRYWNHLPKNGDINIHFRSWYAQYIDYKTRNIRENVRTEYVDIKQDIDNFEEMLMNNGYEIIKFYVHTSEEVRTRHIEKLKSNPILKWKAEEFEEQLDEVDYENEMQHFLDAPTGCPWTVIDFEDKGEAINTLFSTIIDRLEARVEDEEKADEPEVDGAFSEGYEAEFFDFDFEKEKIKKKEYKKILPGLQERMREIQFELYEKKIPLVIVYEGMDAAGKGGNIKRIREKLDPTGYTVNATGAPTDIELAHHYLWRFATDVPRSGHIGFYDRSWYGRVLVERIEGFASNKEWNQAYEEINDFEKSLYNSGAIVLKFFLSLDKDEQLERFEDRQDDPDKQWKLTDEDWRNREKWDLYVEASEDMIRRTHTAHAPWHVVAGNNKKYARITALRKVIEACEARLEKE